MDDRIYYADGSLQITEREIRVPERTYRLADVKSTSLTSARIDSKELERWHFLFYWPLFYLARSWSEPDLWRFDIPLGEPGRSLHIGSGYLFFLLILAARAFLAYRAYVQKSSRVYVATVAGSFGKVAIAAATRRDQMQELVDAINAAMGGYRWAKEALPREMAAQPKVVRFTEETSTRRMVWVNGRTYGTSEIKSIEKTSTTAHPRIVLINLIADVMILCIFVALAWTQAVPKEFSFVGVLALLLLTVPGLLPSTYRSKGPWPVVYLAKLKTAAGTEYPFASLSEEIVQDVIDYISISLPNGLGSGDIADSEVQVDDVKARFGKFGKKIYTVEDIRSVEVEVIRSSSRRQLGLGNSALAMALSLIALDFYLGNDSAHWLAILTAPLLILPGIVLILLSKKTTYTLTLQGRFGEIQAYSSHSERYVRKIANTLRGVLMRRGETMEAQET